VTGLLLPVDGFEAVFILEGMTEEDIGEVSRVERRCFSNTWPVSAYRRELRNAQHSYYVVMRDRPEDILQAASPPDAGDRWPRPRLSLLPFARRDQNGGGKGRIVGFAGMWNLFDEAHITTIGLDPDYRGRNLGEALLLDLIAEAVRRGAALLSLEVRVSNDVAQNLYEKYGFFVHGIRRGYYTDNREDAYVMWSPSLHDDAYLHRLVSLRDQLDRQIGHEVQLPGGHAFVSQGIVSHESPAS
jgi:[ribosomal protein S18]-alanine N-acetyltransferase